MGSVVDQAVFTQLVAEHLPALDAHLKKLQLDLSTFSVPWFLCLYLNSVSLHISIKFLDTFFLEGPKFLFWIAVGILKINEPMLIQKGKDDDIFVAVLKDFFARLGVPESSSSPTTSEEMPDITTLTGQPLFRLLMSEACNVLGPSISTEAIETLRTRYRLDVVHQMEATNRKSQIRTLCEQVSLSFDEVGVVYDEARRLEFIHGDEEEDPTGDVATKSKLAYADEEKMRSILASMGGWGLVRHYLPSQQLPLDHSKKSISLLDFRKIFRVVSPFYSDLCKRLFY